MHTLRRVLDGTARFLARYEGRLLDRPLLVAVSGGLDSAVLLFLLARLQHEGRVPGPVHAAHIDHRTRPGSGDDARFVVSLAESLEVPVHVRRFESPLDAPSEDALRRHRYRLLGDLASELRAGAVLTAHHADDNLETVLFRLLRGTGLRGLSGMPEHRMLPAGFPLLRPLLRHRRATLESLQERWSIAYREDPTNRDTAYARNRIRLETLPALRQRIGKNLDATLMAMMHCARAARAIIEAQGLRILSESGSWTTPWRLDLDLRPGAEDANDPFLRDALRQAWEALAPGHSPLNTGLDRLLALCRARAGTRLEGRPGRHPRPSAERTRTGLILYDAARVPDLPQRAIPFAEDRGRTRFGKSEWWLEGWRHPQPPLNPSPEECGRFRALLDPSRCPRPWHLIVPTTRARLVPLGMNRDVSLSGFLKARGVPRFDRGRLPVLVDAEGEILWLPGVEVSERARLRLNTRSTVEVRAGRG